MPFSLPSTHLGFIPDESFEILDLINSHYLATDFAKWITEGRFTQKILKNQLTGTYYTRTVQYYLEEHCFFNGTLEIETRDLNEELFKLFTVNSSPIYSDNPATSRMKKVSISSVIAEPYFTTISQVYLDKEIIGTSWEIYDLPRLVDIYKNKKDPLRYWRRNRRE